MKDFVTPYGGDLFAGSAPAAPENDSWEITKGVSAGVDQLQATGYGLAGVVGDLSGSQGLRDWGLEGYQRNLEEASQAGIRIQSYDQIESFDDAVDYAMAGLGQALPMLVPSLVSGGAGAIAARNVARKAVARTLEKNLAAGMAKKEAIENAVKTLSTVGAAGGTVGAAGASVGMSTGGIYGQVHEETGEHRADVALSAGAIAGSLDALPIGRILKKLGIGQAAVDGITEKVNDSFKSAIGKQMLAEGSTEVLQTITERAAVKWVDENKDIFSKEGINEIINAGLIGGVAGGTFGGAGKLAQGIGSKDVSQDVEDAEYLATPPFDPEKVAPPPRRGDGFTMSDSQVADLDTQISNLEEAYKKATASGRPSAMKTVWDELERLRATKEGRDPRNSPYDFDLEQPALPSPEGFAGEQVRRGLLGQPLGLPSSDTIYTAPTDSSQVYQGVDNTAAFEGQYQFTTPQARQDVMRQQDPLSGDWIPAGYGDLGPTRPQQPAGLLPRGGQTVYTPPIDDTQLAGYSQRQAQARTAQAFEGQHQPKPQQPQQEQPKPAKAQPQLEDSGDVFVPPTDGQVFDRTNARAMEGEYQQGYGKPSTRAKAQPVTTTTEPAPPQKTAEKQGGKEKAKVTPAQVRERVHKKVSKMSDKEQKLILKSAGVQQSGTKQERADRIADIREAIEVIKEYKDLDAFDADVKSGKISKLDLQRWGNAARSPGTKASPDMATQTHSGNIYALAKRSGIKIDLRNPENEAKYQAEVERAKAESAARKEQEEKAEAEFASKMKTIAPKVKTFWEGASTEERAQLLRDLELRDSKGSELTEKRIQSLAKNKDKVENLPQYATQSLARWAADNWEAREAKQEKPATKPEKKSAPVSEAPEHQAVGVDERELSEIVEEFNEAQDAMLQDDFQMHHLFDAPKKDEIVRLADKAKVYHKDHGWMTPAEAKKKIAEWKEHARSQSKSQNSDKVVLSLFDLTGKWSQPWEEAGYQVYRFDIQEGSINDLGGDDINVGDINNFSTEYFAEIFGGFDGNDVHAILAACPCTDFASSGARHFAAKDKDGRTVESVKLVHQALATIEFFKPAVWAIENPVGRIEKLGGLPPWRLSFDPNHIGDPYTKKTLLWGRFNADLPIAPVEPTEGSKMHSQYGGKSLATKNARSATPEGFAYGFFMANNAIDHPVLAVANKYDRLDRDLIKQALDAGLSEKEIDNLVEDDYYQSLDDEAAEQKLRDAISGTSEEGAPAKDGGTAAVEEEVHTTPDGEQEPIDAQTIEQSAMEAADESLMFDDPKDMQQWLLDKVDQAIKDERAGKGIVESRYIYKDKDRIVFDVPGNGKFKLPFKAENLEGFKKKISKRFAYKHTPSFTMPKPVKGNRSGGSKIAAMRNFADDGEWENVYNLALATDAELVFGRVSEGDDAMLLYLKDSEVEINGTKFVVAQKIDPETRGWFVLHEASGFTLGNIPGTSKADAIKKAKERAKEIGKLKFNDSLVRAKELGDQQTQLQKNFEERIGYTEPLYRKTQERGATRTGPRVEETIERLKSEFSDVPIEVISRADGHPDPAIDMYARQGMGFFYKGKVYVVKDAHKSAAEVEKTILHEAVAHYGLRQMFGNKGIVPLLNRIYAGLNKSQVRGLKKIAEIYDLDLSNRTERQIATEEYIAHIAEKGTDQSLLQKVVGRVREFLRELGLVKGWSDNDIITMLAKSRRNLAAAKGKSSKANNDAFKKWFGNSKVVNPDGSPKMVYHGTSVDFDSFQIEPAARASESWDGGSITPGYGAYFTADPNYASHYANMATKALGGNGRVIPAYLSLQNPKVIKKYNSLERFINDKILNRPAKGLYSERGKASGTLTKEAFEKYQAQGYDGIINEEGNEIIVFDPEQVRSVFDKRARQYATSGYNGKQETLFRIDDEQDARTRSAGVLADGREDPYAEFYAEAEAFEQDGNSRSPEGSASFSRLAAGEEVTLYHRSHSPFEQFDDAFVGSNTETDSASLGHWLSVSNDLDPGRYGDHVSQHKVKLKKPYRLTADEFRILGEKSAAVVNAMKANLEKRGFDGIVIEELEWAAVFKAKSIRKGPGGDGPLFRKEGVDLSEKGGKLDELFDKIDELRNDPASIVKKLKQAAGDGKANSLPAILGAIPRLYLADFAHKSLTAVRKYISGAQEMDAERNQLMGEIAETADRMANYVRKVGNKKAQALWNIMHKATIAGVDPDVGYEAVRTPAEAQAEIERLRGEIKKIDSESKRKKSLTKEQIDKRNELRNEIEKVQTQLANEKNRKADAVELDRDWQALDAEAKSIYREVRDAYKQQREDVMTALEERIAAASQVREKVEPLQQQLEDIREQRNLAWAEDPEVKSLRRRMKQATVDRANAKNDTEFTKANDSYQRLQRQMKLAKKRAAGELDNAIADIQAQIKETIANDGPTSAKIAELRRLFESNRVEGPYFPLARFGDWFGAAKDAEGNLKEFRLFENPSELKEWLAEMEKQNPELELTGGRKKKDGSEIKELDPAFVAKIEELALDKVGGFDGRQLADEIHQLYLQYLPEMSARKHFIHRKGAEGFSGDAMRAFGSQMFHGAHQLAKLRHNWRLQQHLDQLSKQVDDLQQDPDEHGKARALQEELEKRHDWAMNPKGSAMASKLTSFGFAWYLAATPAAALVNITQNPIVAFPTLAAKYGWKKAYKAMSSSMWNGVGIAAKNTGKRAKNRNPFLDKNDKASFADQLSGDELLAYEEMVASGVIDKTQAHDLGGIADHGAEYNSMRHRVMEKIAAMFHGAEVYNRETTALAAYRLARDAGRSHAAAVKEASDMVWKSHFDYSNANRPRYMQNDVAKVALLFRQHSMNMTYRMIRDVNDMFRNADPKERAEARRRLGGILGMTAIFAGAYGLPMFWLVEAVANAMGGDEDEPYDFRDDTRAYLAEMFGDDVADILARGGVDKVTGLSVSGRVGLNGLWVREASQELEGDKMWTHYASQLLGPIFGGIAMDFAVGSEFIAKGETQRGLEKFMPKVARDAAKTFRFATEGVTNLRGDDIMSQEEVTAINLLAQASGFFPAELQKRYEQNNAVKKAEKKITARRTYLLNRYWSAMRRGEQTKLRELLGEIGSFNKANPTYVIDGTTLSRSMKTRMNYSQRSQNGINVSPKLQYLHEKYDFYGK